MNIIIKNVPLETLELHPKLIGIKSSINPKQFKKFLPSIKIYGIGILAFWFKEMNRKSLLELHNFFDWKNYQTCAAAKLHLTF